jgi:hypothetical protein
VVERIRRHLTNVGIGGPSRAGGASPSFGVNNGSSMDYLLVGNW